MRAARALLVVVGAVALTAITERPATAQSDAPVPPEPSRDDTGAEAVRDGPAPKKPPKKARRTVAPGFEDTEADDAGDGADAEPPRRRRPRGRATGFEEPEARGDVNVPEQGTNERLIADLNAATGEVTLGELIDEILADVVAELDLRPAKTFSPLAIRQIALGANVTPAFEQRLESLIIAQLHTGTDIRVVECVECTAVRTRVVDGEWVISRGLATHADLRRVADELGLRSYMDVAFGFDPDTGVLQMDFRVVRASDSVVLWSESFRADETTPMLMRSSDAPARRKDRLRDLEMLLEGRPLYGYVATAGFMLLPYSDPVGGDIGGATAGYRIYERFGTERRVMFGLDLTGFLNTSRLAGAVMSAGSWWIPLRPDLVNPELRLGAKAGAFIAGSAGNAAVFQLGAEVILRYRFGLYAYVLFMTKSEFPPDSGDELGGVGMSTGMSFNW
ncbi:hypothetical protein L6R52_20315 [Myxococcota bacterium]|nr:hypothetical protein [Myxococcota bacterium]